MDRKPPSRHFPAADDAAQQCPRHDFAGSWNAFRNGDSEQYVRHRPGHNATASPQRGKPNTTSRPTEARSSAWPKDMVEPEPVQAVRCRVPERFCRRSVPVGWPGHGEYEYMHGFRNGSALAMRALFLFLGWVMPAASFASTPLAAADFLSGSPRAIGAAAAIPASSPKNFAAPVSTSALPAPRSQSAQTDCPQAAVRLMQAPAPLLRPRCPRRRGAPSGPCGSRRSGNTQQASAGSRVEKGPVPCLA